MADFKTETPFWTIQMEPMKSYDPGKQKNPSENVAEGGQSNLKYEKDVNYCCWL